MKITAKFEDLRSAAKPEPAKSSKADGVSPAARNLALAYRLDDLIEKGLLADYTAAARLLHVSQVRITHLMSLLLLAPTIQEAIVAGTLAPGDKQLRQLARLAAWNEQLDALAKLQLPRRGRMRAPQPRPEQPSAGDAGIPCS